MACLARWGIHGVIRRRDDVRSSASEAPPSSKVEALFAEAVKVKIGWKIK